MLLTFRLADEKSSEVFIVRKVPSRGSQIETVSGEEGRILSHDAHLQQPRGGFMRRVRAFGRTIPRPLSAGGVNVVQSAGGSSAGGELEGGREPQV